MTINSSFQTVSMYEKSHPAICNEEGLPRNREANALAKITIKNNIRNNVYTVMVCASSSSVRSHEFAINYINERLYIYIYVI